MPNAPEIFKRRNSLLHLWCMLYAFDRTVQKNRFEVKSNPFFPMKENDSRGPRHGPQQWQYDHWKAKHATRGLKRGYYDSIVHRWHADKRYRESQWNIGWTEEYCRYLDLQATVDIKYIATWPERSRYHNMLVFKLEDEKDSGKMSHRDDFQSCSPITCCSRTPRKKEGKTPVFRSRTEKDNCRSMRSCDQNLEWQSWYYWEICDRKRHLHLRHPGNLKNGKNDINGKSDKIGMDGTNGYRFPELPKSLCTFLCQSVVFFKNISRTDISECRARDGE